LNQVVHTLTTVKNGEKDLGKIVEEQVTKGSDAVFRLGGGGVGMSFVSLMLHRYRAFLRVSE
jgi:hypothetical protein